MNRRIFLKSTIDVFLKPFLIPKICRQPCSRTLTFDKYKTNQYSLTVLKSPSRKIYSSSLCLKSHENANNEPCQNVLNDEEFQNILKSFSKDFDVSSDSEKILEDIKKSLEETSENDRSEEENLIDQKDFKSTIHKNNFKEFVDSDSVTIHSYEDLTSNASEEQYYHVDQDLNLRVPLEKMTRGVFGVFDIHELVDVLHKERLMDIAVISVPKEFHYTDFIVLVTAMSPRHSKAVCENILKVYKMKKHRKDSFIKPEGEKNDDWKAVDMGNIVLHIFLEETRAFYDIESLWLFDSNFDTGGTLKSDPAFDIIKEQMEFFNTLQDTQTQEPI